jgi:hypothetical protein
VKTLTNAIFALAAGVFLTPGVANAQRSGESSIPLPSEAQRSYLSAKPRGTTRGPSPTITTDVIVESVPTDSWYSTRVPTGSPLIQPLRSANELVILLDPALTGPQIEAALKEHNLVLIDAAPQIGSVTVDASARLGSAAVPSSASSVEGISVSALSVLARKIAEDKRFITVTANTIVSPFGIRSAIDPIPAGPSPGAAAEQIDWGIADGKFDKYWGAAVRPFIVGVIDVGFAEHEDLATRDGLKTVAPSDNHGNHVAGIMCAKHNGIGTKGALKDCVTVISAGHFLLVGDNQPQGNGISPFKTRFSEYLATVLEFMEANADVKILNLSLGYNWMPNFGLDPREPSATEVRNEVMGQGRVFAAVLAYAKARDVALISAAGNDSQTLGDPLEAKWASPFNFGTALVEQADGWTNGLIVEAHDASHKRADFSNDEGHISCPGVEILSLLARPKNSYGRMSGTSMASPYCAAGLALLRSMRPDLDLRQAIACLRSSPEKIGNVPRMNLEYSISRCKRGNGT